MSSNSALQDLVLGLLNVSKTEIYFCLISVKNTKFTDISYISLLALFYSEVHVDVTSLNLVNLWTYDLMMKVKTRSEYILMLLEYFGNDMSPSTAIHQ